MLSSMTEVCLGTVKEERHAFQASIVNMVEQAMSSTKVHMEKALEEAKVQADGVYQDREDRKDAHEKAKATLVDLEQALVSKKEALTTASAKRDALLEELNSAEQAQREGDKDSVEVEEKKAQVVGAISALASLKTAMESSKQRKAAIKSLVDTAREFGVDSSLLTSAPLVLQKEPSERAGFDMVVIQNFEDALAALGVLFASSAARPGGRRSASPASWAAPGPPRTA